MTGPSATPRRTLSRGARAGVVGAVVAVLAGGSVVGVAMLRGGGAAPEPGGTSRPPDPTPASGVASPGQAAGVRIVGVGDVIMGSTPRLPPDDGRTFFDAVDQDLRGDVTMGNFEGALTDFSNYTKCRPPSPTPSPAQSPAKVTCRAFRMPPHYAQWLRRAGFTVMSLANNHTLDYSERGLSDTKKNLTRYGVAHTGMPDQVTVLQAAGMRVAVLGFSPYRWSASVIDVDEAADLVRRAGTMADVVVVNMHAGAEGSDKTHVRPGTETYLGENRGDPLAFAHAVVDAGADLVVGHGPHVMRGMEWYKGRLIAYSVGNFAGYASLSTAGLVGLGGILRVTLRQDGSWAAGELVGTRMTSRGLPALDRSGDGYDLVRRLSRSDFGQRAVELGPDGKITPPAG